MVWVAATIALAVLSTAPAAPSNVFVVGTDPDAAGTLIDPSAAIWFSSIAETTSSALCMPSPLEPATITVTAAAQKVGQPETYTMTLLARCHIPLEKVRPTATATPSRSSESGAHYMPWRFTDLAYDPPAAADLAGFRAPDGASVFSGPPDPGIGSEPTESTPFIYAYNPPRDAGAADAQRTTTARTSALSVTVARFRDLGLAAQVLDRFRLTADRSDRSVDALDSYHAPPISSVFTAPPNTSADLATDDFDWPVGAVAQNSNPGSVRTAARPVLSAAVSRQGASRTYASVLAAIP